jgi:hypothetical protein
VFEGGLRAWVRHYPAVKEKLYLVVAAAVSSIPYRSKVAEEMLLCEVMFSSGYA